MRSHCRNMNEILKVVFCTETGNVLGMRRAPEGVFMFDGCSGFTYNWAALASSHADNFFFFNFQEVVVSEM